jgi:putative restriction endonuclease
VGVVPVLDAAHIKPYAREGTHDPHNGILLRSDLHTLFDLGYVTITPEYHFEVSKHVREDYENGHEYYALHGQSIHVPVKQVYQPAGENLAWHNEKVFRG